jgi:hypothetical protein
MPEIDPSDPRTRLAVEVETLRSWSQCVDNLTWALSYAKTWEPPAEIPEQYVSVSEFIRRAEELLQIARSWPGAHGD